MDSNERDEIEYILDPGTYFKYHYEYYIVEEMSTILMPDHPRQDCKKLGSQIGYTFTVMDLAHIKIVTK